MWGVGVSVSLSVGVLSTNSGQLRWVAWD